MVGNESAKADGIFGFIGEDFLDVSKGGKRMADAGRESEEAVGEINKVGKIGDDKDEAVETSSTSGDFEDENEVEDDSEDVSDNWEVAVAEGAVGIFGLVCFGEFGLKFFKIGLKIRE